MKLLIVDTTSEAQALCAKRIEAFSSTDLEVLDLRVKLVGEKDVIDRLQEAEVLIIGSGLGDRGVSLARKATTLVPWIHIILYVTDEAYSGGAFRSAYTSGVRKVFPDGASPMDLLQELIAINTEFRRAGRAREGRFIAFTHAKGGVGCTSVVAALGEVCSIYNKRTLLWDLDVETRDLSRALNVSGPEAQVLSAWVNGSREVSRDSLEEALVPISQEVSVLMPPDRMAECMDLVCHTDGIAIVERLVETARVLFDVVLADTGGRMGPAVGALLRAADLVIIVIDDSLLGLTAVDLYLRYVRTLLGGSDRVLFLVNPFSGADISVSEIASQLSAAGNFSENSWRLPALPNDPRAAIWPGSGSTLYGNGGKLTRAVLERIARELQIIDGTAKAATAAEGPRGVEERRSNPLLADPNNVIRTKSGNWIQKLIKKR